MGTQGSSTELIVWITTNLSFLVFALSSHSKIFFFFWPGEWAFQGWREVDRVLSPIVQVSTLEPPATQYRKQWRRPKHGLPCWFPTWNCQLWGLPSFLLLFWVGCWRELSTQASSAYGGDWPRNIEIIQSSSEAQVLGHALYLNQSLCQRFLNKQISKQTKKHFWIAP